LANRQFSFREWLDGSNAAQPRTVVVQRSGRYPELSAAWIGAVVDTIAAHVNDESFPNSQTRRVFLCLDELAS
ncbi:type IV secretion system DNA-binding domain-containing protein, partial [Klebsiella pneumoniae]|nr:type IV secretion system DNA-binding domain-containing protein [Klebsiella pneumoniae]